MQVHYKKKILHATNIYIYIYINYIMQLITDIYMIYNLW